MMPHINIVNITYNFFHFWPFMITYMYIGSIYFIYATGVFKLIIEGGTYESLFISLFPLPAMPMH